MLKGREVISRYHLCFRK